MDATQLAAELLEPIPAHRTFGLRVVRAVEACAEVALTVHPALTNVIGSLHSSGLATDVESLDEDGRVVCRGSFTWQLRRVTAPATTRS